MLPIDVNVLGRVTDFKELQPLKPQLLIVVTLSGIKTVVTVTQKNTD